ncbi:uncharacterized protein BDW47DRAFT_114815 [Aspergillus candidus]|uniref:Xylanolytic transcriptional activator regulatory domain-containing protein n=1 Tax=Aspergillus candidus TaxID=41067 RepID=A0A2I2FN37_ASPCN|nr:hypothetical protein BDW47DRAFT_114815 [Aspergillus candidus]PLB42053.1 hypothetical protein BDW47DRAFT_114815 [Aspergillus candidus]
MTGAKMVLEDIPLAHDSEVTQPQLSRPGVVRKKFAKPPVKVACLTCSSFVFYLIFPSFGGEGRLRCFRSSTPKPLRSHRMPYRTSPHPRIQIAHADTIAFIKCLSKKKKCSYLPSKRGGPRKKKKASFSPEGGTRQDEIQTPAIVSASSSFDESSGMFGQIDVLSMPGAGLRSLDFSSDVHSMFANFFVQNDGSCAHVQMGPTPSPSNVSSNAWVRTYASESEILNAYYTFVHLYFPLLPPRETLPGPDRPVECVGSYSESPSEEPILVYRPCSPLSLAISAILALVPHPQDPDPSSPVSVTRRRTYAHAFAQLATAKVESDCELQDSSTDPAQALSNDRPQIGRDAFHPRTPVILEAVLALLILSIYEYTQRGNLLKMRYRSGQALAIALDMNLHALGEEHDDFAEARRRAWWMTYYCVLQGSIVSTTPLAIIANDPQFVTPYPRFSTDPDGWSILMQAQQVLVSATQFVIDLNKCIGTRTNMHFIYERMRQLDSWASTALAQSNLLPIAPQPVNCGDEMEFTTAQSIRAISRIKICSSQIKIHRFRAFSDIPIFIKKHCDLTAANANNNAAPAKTTKACKAEEGISTISCPCSSLDSFQASSSSENSASSNSSSSSDYQPVSQYSFSSGFPFTSQYSARVCLKASILLSRMFQSLPFPQPVYDGHEDQQGSQQILPAGQPPRTMPSFACCLMQGSYAMLMVFYKARVERQLSPPELTTSNSSSPSERLLKELRQGLQRIIASVSNYAIAFEALDGMRDEIEGAYHTAFYQA